MARKKKKKAKIKHLLHGEKSHRIKYFQHANSREQSVIRRQKFLFVKCRHKSGEVLRENISHWECTTGSSSPHFPVLKARGYAKGGSIFTTRLACNLRPIEYRISSSPPPPPHTHTPLYRWHCTKSSDCQVRVRGAPSNVYGVNVTKAVIGAYMWQWWLVQILWHLPYVFSSFSCLMNYYTVTFATCWYLGVGVYIATDILCESDGCHCKLPVSR